MWFVFGLGPQSGQRYHGDTWADSREHFDIAFSFEKTYSIFSHCQLWNSGAYCNRMFWRLDINGYIGIKKGIDKLMTIRFINSF